MTIKHSGLDRLLLVLNGILLALAVLVVVIPLLYVVVASFMDPSALLSRGLSLSCPTGLLKATK
jgi:putative aldouronate transport system permease protein